MHKDLVSVVIPCYNQAHFLPQAIESVLAQTYRNFEILVVDDGSTDATAQTAASYVGVRCIQQHNQGLSAARNTGLRAVQGEFLVFLDADDRLLPHALKTLLDLLAANPECVFVSGRTREIAADGSPSPTPHHPLIEKEHYRTLLQYCYICTSGAVMFRREIFQFVHEYNPTLVATGDYDLYLRIARDFSVYDADVVVAEYRRHANQMTRDQALMLKECIAVLRSQRKFVRRNPQDKEALEQGIQVMQDFYGEPLVGQIREASRAGHWQQAVRGLLILLTYWPQGLVKHVLRRSGEEKRTASEVDHDANS